MCLIVEIIFFIAGLIGLIGGKLTITKNFPLEGTRARIAGLILALDLPLAFGIGLMYGLLIRAGTIPSSMTPYAACIDVVLLLVCGGGAFGYAYATRPPQEPPAATLPPQPPAVPPIQ
jgi:hypothetical protein